jgi:putative oxidoreductase
MNVVYIVARILLGLMFTLFGLNGFFHFLPGAPPPGAATDFFNAVALESHYYMLIFGAQLVAGLLLLSNQYVPLALVTLAAVLANILTFHLAMAPASIGPGIFAALVWVVVCWSVRSQFASLLARTPSVSN